MIVAVAIALFLVGLALTAFFSGVETGFFRAPRVRLQLDALAGDRLARALFWLSNRPGLFVATALLGNNLADDVLSLALVIIADSMQWEGNLPEILLPIALSPLLYAFGAALPKQLFLEAPYALLRKAGPLFLVFTILLAPLSLLLWGLSKLLERFSGHSQQVELTLARRELESVLEEGHAVGLLRRAQRQLAQGLFAVASEPVARFALPPQRLTPARLGMTNDDVLQLAGRQHAAELPVEEPLGRRKPIGYVRVSEIRLEQGDELRKVRPLIDIPHTETHISALVKLYEAGETMARLVDHNGATVGLVTADALADPLFRGER
jgi:CBS domain containing-hemolysin-like protein